MTSQHDNGSRALPESHHWVFGYGSLIWKQDFAFVDAQPASISGWARRFWQGSHDHRGLEHDPGRVVTLVESPGAVCAGRAFLVAQAVFEHLDFREKNGYQRRAVNIRIGDRDVAGVVYVATRDNPAFLGPAPPEEMARQIARCRGPSGSNREYLERLSSALRALGEEDRHVFELEALVRSLSV